MDKENNQDLPINQKSLHKKLETSFDYEAGLQAMNQRIKRNWSSIQSFVEHNEVNIPNLIENIIPFKKLKPFLIKENSGISPSLMQLQDSTEQQ